MKHHHLLRMAMVLGLTLSVVGGLYPKTASAATPILWVNHFDLLPGDPSVVSTSASLASSNPLGLLGLVITSSTLGEVDSTSSNKIVHMALDLPRSTKIKGVRVCYELTDSRSFISQIRLAQVQDPPSSALVLLDDGTDLVDPGPTCVDSDSTSIKSRDGSVLLSLRVNFGNTNDKIVIRALGLK